MKRIVQARGLGRTFGTGRGATRALHHVDLDLAPGEMIALLGPSGSGKTTLLNLIGALDSASAGALVVDGVDLTVADRRERERFRRDHVGFVFQFFNLVPNLTAFENVALVNELVGRGDRSAAREALDAVGLNDRADAFPTTLSGGEQQRVAVARAIAKDPSLLLCDEPTGSLDLETGRHVLGVLRALRDQGRTVIVVTHNSAIAAIADCVVRLRDGTVVEQERVANPVNAAEIEW